MKIIAGMHRSGSSLVASTVLEAGGNLGDPDSFHPPDRWNPRGYFELPEIIDANRTMVHGPWGRLAYLRLPSRETILRRGESLAPRLADLATRYDDRIVKENRFSLTLPAWRACGADIEQLLIPLRSPGAVAESLRRRNWIPLRLGYRLWREHYRRLLDASAHLPRWLVRYDRLIDPESRDREVRGMLHFLGLADESSRARACSAVERALDHSSDGDRSYRARVGNLWDELRRRHDDQEL